MIAISLPRYLCVASHGTRNGQRDDQIATTLLREIAAVLSPRIKKLGTMVAVDLALMTLKMRADAVAVLPPEMIVRKREMSTSLSNLETTGATVSHPKYICVKMLTVLVGTEE